MNKVPRTPSPNTPPPDKLSVFDYEVPYVASCAAVELDNIALGRGVDSPPNVNKLIEMIQTDLDVSTEVAFLRVLEALGADVSKIKTASDLNAEIEKIISRFRSFRQHAPELRNFCIALSRQFGAEQYPSRRLCTESS